jgi:hypothetical protein
MKGVDDAFLGVGDKPYVPRPDLLSVNFRVRLFFLVPLFTRIVLWDKESRLSPHLNTRSSQNPSLDYSLLLKDADFLVWSRKCTSSP